MTTNPTGGDPTDARLVMARRCAAKYWQTGEPSDEAAARSILSGEWDDQAYTQAALAAIIETTEAAANMIDHQTPTPAGGPLSHTNSMRVVMQDAARSLRNNAHLKAPQP